MSNDRDEFADLDALESEEAGAVDEIDESGADEPEAVLKEKGTVSRTQVFQDAIKDALTAELGKKISRDQSWKIFKAIISTTVQEVAKNGRAPLQGVGTFEVIKAGCRKSKLVTHNFVPKFRFRPGSKIDEFLDRSVPGVHKTEEEKKEVLAAHPEYSQFLEKPAETKDA